MNEGHFGCCGLTLALHGAVTGDSQLIARVRESGLFERVVVARSSYPSCRHLGTKTLWDFTARRRASERRFNSTFPELAGLSFDCLITSCADRPALEAKRFLVPEGETYFIDDGEGTRTGFVLRPLACFDDNAARSARTESVGGKCRYMTRLLANRVIGRRANLNLKRIYSFAIDAAFAKQTYNYIPVTAIGVGDNCDLPAKIVNTACPTNDYSAVDQIYLSLPGDMDSKVLGRELELVKLMMDSSNGQLRIRLHPRRSSDDFKQFTGSILDRAFWESLVLNGTIDDSVTLIALGSTAQSSPFTLAGVEPRCVYLYRLFGSEIVDLEPFNEMAKNLKGAYHDPERVAVPSCEAELVKAMARGVA